ncbi:MAG: methyltransferase domain-containing protein [Xanthomonadaceae bacterium]|nr:methyltransferase domain-containing protein [Xanthomonadaceae bacterium]
MAETLRQASPVIARVYGRWALHLRPCEGASCALTGHRANRLLNLTRSGDRLSGDAQCRDDALPVADASVALIVAQHVLETSDRPEQLIASLARILEPEGTLMILLLNPLGPARLRWRGCGLRPPGAAVVRQWLHDNDLQVDSCSGLGPLWGPPDAVDPDPSARRRYLERFLFARLVIARKHQAGLIPIRPGRRALRLGSGVQAG